MKKISSLLLAVSVLSAAAQPALAQGWHHDGHEDIHGFYGHDYDHWRGGSWYNGIHGGRNGWWWIVDGAWYFYPKPVYPYPDPYTPPVVAVAPGAPVAVATAYYYCRNPAGYYPYVPQCFGHWHRVVASTAPATVVVQQPPQTVVVQGAPPQAAAPYPGAVPPVAPGGEKAADEHQLKDMEAEFKHISAADPQALVRLQNMEGQVEAFRQTLYTRGYNAMKLLKSSEELQRHIAEKRAAFSGGMPPMAMPGQPMPGTPIQPPQAVPGPEGGMPPGGPAALPPGSPVTFPPAQ